MSNDTSSLPVAKRLGYILKRTQQSLRARMDTELRSLELTTPQYAVLSAIEGSPGISNADLAKAAFVTAQTMQGIIATLEKRGLIERSADPDHGRRLKAQLTEAGLALLLTADVEVTKIEAGMLQSISTQDAEHAMEILLACIENLSETS